MTKESPTTSTTGCSFHQKKTSKASVGAVTTTAATAALEAVYRSALAAFKAEKDTTRKKELRRARTTAKKAWDEAVLKDCLASDSGAEALHCRDCSQMFLWTTEDQSYYKASERRWNHRPLRCRVCAESQKTRRKNNNLQHDVKGDGGESAGAEADTVCRVVGKAGRNMCYAFQRGECRYGDRCKFNHDPNFAGKNRDEKGDSDGNEEKGKEESSGDPGNETKNEEELRKKRKLVPDIIPVCKWGTKCTIKKCRFRHVDESTKTDSLFKTNPAKAETATAAAITAVSDSSSKNKAPRTVPTGICKWGMNCRLKRCRLQHVENNIENQTKDICVEARTDSAPTLTLNSKTETTNNKKVSDKEPITTTTITTKTKKKEKRSDKTVIKAVRNALKKAPKKQLTVRELRKQLKVCLSEDGATGKDDAKRMVKKAIANHKDSLVLLEGGKVVKLL